MKKHQCKESALHFRTTVRRVVRFITVRVIIPIMIRTIITIIIISIIIIVITIIIMILVHDLIPGCNRDKDTAVTLMGGRLS